MEYCQYGDLYSYLQTVRKNQVCKNMKEQNRALEWFIQVTLAVSFLHERNILHRDLKSQNIFMQGTPK